MAINHGDCTHPRTPAGRAACRARAGVAAPTTRRNAETPAETKIRVDADLAANPITRKPATWTVEPRTGRGPIPRIMSASDAAMLPDGPHPGRVRRAARNERAGTVVDGEKAIPADMPTMLANVARLAWDRDGWACTIGARYNDAEKRVVVTTPHGELSLVWKADTTANVWGVFFRAASSSVARRVDTVNAGLRLANGQDA